MLTLILLYAIASSAYAQESKTVNITQGQLIGYKVDSEDVFAFYSVHYATAPTGPDKFKAPLPPPTWTEPYEAVDKGIVCPQSPMRVPANRVVQEDCLIASIYVPNTNETNLPVVVVIHGGAFQGGFGDARTPIKLVASKRLIAITFNYRVGVHGFLCLGTEDIPGNAGMKDQVAMLRWVKENIARFGGNPDDVTVAGCSAGGASTDLLTLSKMTRGLFKKVIALSGSSIGVFGVQSDPVAHALELARNLNFTEHNQFRSVENFFKEAPYDVLSAYSQNENKHSAVIFSPCIERDVGQEMFLDDTPVNIIKSDHYVKYPMLYGFADREGLFRISFFDTWINDMNEKFSDFLPYDLAFEDEEEKEKVALKVKEFYFGEGRIGTQHVINYVNYFTDVMFVYAMLRSVTMQVNAGNNAMYLFTYSYVDNNTNVIPHTQDERGATHCTQIAAAFDENEATITNAYRDMKATMRDVWINFIVTGNPTPGEATETIPRWIPANATRSPCMSFGTEKVELLGSIFQERAAIWDPIYDQYHREPIPPRGAANGLAVSMLMIITVILKFLIY